jgi:hypothetical protein
VDPRVEPVVHETNENRVQFEAFCRLLSPEQLSAPVPASIWQVKDYISHLASIDIWVGEWFEHLADGRRWRPAGEHGAPFSIDTWNQSRIDERHDTSVDGLLREAAEHRERLWTTVDRFSPEVLDQTFNFRGHDITFLRYLQLWAGHDPAHTTDMLRALPALASEPSLKTWLGRYSF